MTKRKHWYSRRSWKEAPSDLADPSWTTYGAWARGYNDAVQAYADELREALVREGVAL